MLRLLLLVVAYYAVPALCTVLAAKCSGGNGIVIGTDSLDAHGGTVENRFSEKVVRINPLTLVCMAASNSDVRSLCNELRRICLMHKADCDEVLGVDSLARAARQLVHASFPAAHVLIVGCSSSAKLDIHEILPGGSHIEDQDVAVAGSGSAMVVTLIQELWESARRSDQPLSKSDATLISDSPAATAARIKKAMQAVIRSDAGSGGKVALWSLCMKGERVEIAKL